MAILRYATISLLTIVIVAPCHATPDLVCDESRFDFGQQLGGGHVSHSFTLFNAGDSDLEITEIKSSCGCTTAELDDRLLSPGEDVSLAVRLSVGSRRGAVRKTIRIYSNDPDEPELTLQLVGSVFLPVTVTPAKVFFGQVAPDASVTEGAEVVVSTQSPLHIRSTEVIAGNGQEVNENLAQRIQVKTQTITEGSQYAIEVSFAPEGELGKLDATIRVHTDNTQMRTIEIPVSAVVSGEVCVAPQSIVLDTDRDQSVTRYLLVTRRRNGNGAGQPFEVTAVHVPNDDIEVEVRPVGRYAYRIQLRNLSATSELVDGEVVIETDVPSMPRVSVPLRLVQDDSVIESTARANDE